VKRTLNCRIILVDEMALDQLDGEARFTDATASDHHQLIFSQELCRQAEKSVTARQLQGRQRKRRRGTIPPGATETRTSDEPWRPS